VRAWTVALFLLVAITLGAFGQIALKYGMKQHGSLGAPGASMAGSLFQAIFTPYVLLGLFLYAVSSCFWLVVLSKWSLSYAYPMIATNYLLVVLLSRFFFDEKVVPLQWAGIVLMVSGLMMVARFGSATG
jgi:multidrug transporter EmrE-like cation transporter